MLFDRYLSRQILGAFLLIVFTLSAVIMLTQSLRFLELVMNSGASSSAFWLLTVMALPRLFEVIVPIALMISVIFVYNRMSSDSELTVMRSAGYSPLRLSRPAIFWGCILSSFLLFNAMWLSPYSLSALHELRQNIKTEYSSLLLREGVFNAVGNNLTVYIQKRADKGELQGLMIHDSRPELPAPLTIIAKRGLVVATETGQQVVVFDGSRQDMNPKTGALNRLDFSQYSLDLPENSAVNTRWREPEERTFIELFHPDATTLKTTRGAYKFMVEANRRVIGPFLSLTFCFVALACLLVGKVDRRGQGRRLLLTVCLIILVQSAYMGALNLANQHIWGIPLLYAVVLMPLILGFMALNHEGDGARLWQLLSTKQKRRTYA